MKKIHITGNAGSGKTSLAEVLSKKLSIDYFGLDSIVWQSGWEKTPKNQKEKMIQELIAKESWIIEGVSKQVFQTSDTIIFLDLPLYICLFNILKRFFKNGLKTRVGIPSKCPEYIGIFKAIKIALIYQKLTRPFLINLVAKTSDNKTIYHIQNTKDKTKLLKKLITG